MSLAEEMETLKRQVAASVPRETLGTLNEGTERLRQSGIAARSLKVGDEAPDFTVPNVRGEEVSLAGLLKKGPAVLSFYRGGWCPFCSLELRSLQLALPRIEGLGATLAALSPQLPDNSLSTAQKLAIEFEVLSDVGNETARAFGLVFTLPGELRPIYEALGIDLPAANGDETFELPMPATYVVDKDSTIALAFVDPDYTRRLEPEEVIEALKRLKVGGRLSF